VFIFKDLELNIVVNVIYRRKVDSLTLFLLIVVDLLIYVRHIANVAQDVRK
jgi:hypothetical protein